MIVACDVPFHWYIKPKAHLPHPVGIVVSRHAKIGKNVALFQNVTIGAKEWNKRDYPIIEDGVIIYTNSIIAGNVTIPKNKIIPCNSVIIGDK